MTPPKELALRPISRPVDKSVCLPGSKSLTNRALLVAGLSRGTSSLEGVLLAEDTWLMIDALKALGLSVRIDAERRIAAVVGNGGYWPNSDADIFCGNAGTVIRFLAAACSAGVGEYRLDGSPRMRQRPIRDLVDALRDLGASIGYEASEGCCPLTIRANGLRGGEVVLDRPVSSQFLSALLMAAPRAVNDVFVGVKGGIPSAPYVRMTVEVMRKFGVEVLHEGMQSFIVPAPQFYTATNFRIEPDATAASYFFAAAAVSGGRITVEGLGGESCQGDLGFARVLESMSCGVEQGPRHTTVRGPSDGRLRGVDVDLSDMPDVAPTLAVVAAFADSPTRIRNVGNLRVKETDRLFALATQLGRLGVETEVSADSLTIVPTRPPTAGIIDTYDDHRMAMSFAVAGLRLDGVIIRDPGCVGKTFPEFFEMWGELDK
jgi:3-phosphoshikimate 1-carboxyvinyltransferase